MQEKFELTAEAAAALKSSFSEVRLKRYLDQSKGDINAALMLYRWNIVLSQALYLPLQIWEVTLRNKINAAFSSRFGSGWPYVENFRRQLKSQEERKIKDAIDRQERYRGFPKPSTDIIVADLSASFWVGVMGKGYDIPFTWRNWVKRVFPNDATADRAKMHGICMDLLDLRNRIAHHEPIYHLDLQGLRDDLDDVIGAMCVGSRAFIDATCTFDEALKLKP